MDSLWLVVKGVGIRVVLAVWLSGNALASINVVALHQTRLVPRWVTVCAQVNHLQGNNPAMNKIRFFHKLVLKTSIYQW